MSTRSKHHPLNFFVQSTGRFSVAVSCKLMVLMLSVCKNTLLRPDLEHFFHNLRKDFSTQVTEFTDKFSPLVLNKRFDKKVLLGAKITFYYEDED